jgi:hypothetical protein
LKLNRSNIKFRKNNLSIEIDGKKHEFQLKLISRKLLTASTIERNFYKISPSGCGVQSPLIDEDLSIKSLINLPSI